MMRWMLVVLVACSGVKADPDANELEDALEIFATERCQWNFDCEARKDATCVDTTIGIVDGDITPNDRSQCLACMRAWTQVFDEIHDSCATELTLAQSQAVFNWCGDSFDDCTRHDLPGGDPAMGTSSAR